MDDLYVFDRGLTAAEVGQLYGDGNGPSGGEVVLPAVNFEATDDALDGIESINDDYQRHCVAAREIAEEYFDSRRVLTQMLDTIFG